MGAVKLPVKNESENYEIRLESIGGLGANLCGKMLGELGIKYLGLNSTSFSSYGSEKTGTPVKAYIRYSEGDKEIRVHFPVVHPHILCIFHQALINDSTIFDGCTKDTIIVLNTRMSQEEMKNSILYKNGCIEAAAVFCVPAEKIAMETHSRINVVMLGAVAKAMGFVELKSVNKICEDTLGRKYPEALSSNLLGIKRGYEEIVNCGVVNKSVSCGKQNHVKETVWGYKNAPIGGINTNYGNSIISDLSPSRQGYIPVFIQDKCINCGLCDSTCPDMVFQFQKGEYKGKEMMINRGLDYYHCKGCLRCVEVCPTQALVKGLETEDSEKKWFVPNQDMMRYPDYYKKTGANGYITSESYLTEERIEGGEV